VSFGLGVANRFVAGCGPVRPWGYCPPRPCYRPYRSYWSWGYPREVFYNPRYNCVNYALPAVYYPAELGYGPQAVKQFMGVDRNFAMGPLTLTSYDAARDAKPSIELDPPTRVSNTRTLELAQRYVQFGDARFRGQQYHEALQRYRTATATAPDLASAHIKYGLTLAVTGRQEAAVKSIARGLDLDPDWPTRGFALDDIYGDGRAAKIGHLDALARTVLADSDSAEATYLLGVFLYLDGHKDRAQKILRRSADLMGDDKPIVPFTEPAPLDVKLAAVPL
jgi:tetratricopeptide (TPR) repeat protein